MDLSLNTYTLHFIEIWKDFCDLHQNLYELTMQEYQLLLDSDLESLDGQLEHKVFTIDKINQLELKRNLLIDDLLGKLKLSKTDVKKVGQLLLALEETEDYSLLNKYNNYLIEVIEKIQTQNKKNKLFLNKAIHNLNQIKKDFSGKPCVETYNSHGEKKLSYK
jgi:flagellar biosynthesis/type III secretory pathway chaperone